MPERKQLRRTKGYRLRGAQSVARPTKWGNPNRVQRVAGGWQVRWAPTGREPGGTVGDWPTKAHAQRFAVESFKDALERDDGSLPFTKAEAKRDLRGLDLACWCAPDEECHADVLLDLANPGRHTETPAR